SLKSPGRMASDSPGAREAGWVEGRVTGAVVGPAAASRGARSATQPNTMPAVRSNKEPLRTRVVSVNSRPAKAAPSLPDICPSRWDRWDRHSCLSLFLLFDFGVGQTFLSVTGRAFLPTHS